MSVRVQTRRLFCSGQRDSIPTSSLWVAQNNNNKKKYLVRILWTSSQRYVLYVRWVFNASKYNCCTHSPDVVKKSIYSSSMCDELVSSICHIDTNAFVVKYLAWCTKLWNVSHGRKWIVPAALHDRWTGQRPVVLRKRHSKTISRCTEAKKVACRWTHGYSGYSLEKQ